MANKFRQQQGWQTVRNAWVLLSSILETAVEYGYLQANPARGVKFPQEALKVTPVLIVGEAFAALLAQMTEPHRTMVGLIAATGLRIGELLALRWRPSTWRSARCASRKRSTKDSSSSRKQSGRDERFLWGHRRCASSASIAGAWREPRTTISSSAIARASRCVSPSC